MRRLYVGRFLRSCFDFECLEVGSRRRLGFGSPGRGKGGMGVVVAARHKQLGHKVAIKCLRPELGSFQSAISRFLREAQAAVAGGMATLARAAIDKVLAGVTTIEEVYRVVETDEEFRMSCQACGASLSPGFLMCPGCGHPIGSACPHCMKTVSPEWKFCPYCKHGLPQAVNARSFS